MERNVWSGLSSSVATQEAEADGCRNGGVERGVAMMPFPVTGYSGRGAEAAAVASGPGEGPGEDPGEEHSQRL